MDLFMEYPQNFLQVSDDAVCGLSSRVSRRNCSLSQLWSLLYSADERSREMDCEGFFTKIVGGLITRSVDHAC